MWGQRNVGTNGTFTYFHYDWRGRSDYVIDQDSNKTSYGYDDADRLAGGPALIQFRHPGGWPRLLILLSFIQQSGHSWGLAVNFQHVVPILKPYEHRSRRSGAGDGDRRDVHCF
jgi:YD repeat-containing protein